MEEFVVFTLALAKIFIPMGVAAWLTMHALRLVSPSFRRWYRSISD